MGYTNPKTQKEAQHQWYKNNKERLLEKQRQRRRKAKERFLEFKKTLKCERCVEAHPACLDFHHKDPQEKDKGIAEAVDSGWSVERLKKELEKCMVLCSNCHRKLHAAEFGGA